LLDNIQPGTYATVADNVTGVTFGSVAPNPPVNLFYSTVLHRLFEFNVGIGKYISRYWCDGDPLIKMWVEMTESQIAAWDNPAGEAVVVGAETYTGPFWEIDHAYDGRSPMGVGTIVSDTPNNRTAALATDLGAGSTSDVAKHTHRVEFDDQPAGEVYTHFDPGDAPPAHGAIFDPVGQGVGLNAVNMIAMENTGPDGISLLHPVRVGYMVKRTGRLFFAI